VEKSQRVIVISEEFKDTDPILSQNKLSEAKEMARIYPFIYVLENSIREVIDRVMKSRYGENWWNIKAPRKLKDDVAGRMAEDKRDSWHQRRSNRPIDYVDLNDLPRLVRKIEREIVPNIISDLQWFSEMVKEVYKSRCVVCHMNPLDKDNIQGVKLRYKQWQKQIKAKKNLI
jgi:hypothetical protein